MKQNYDLPCYVDDIHPNCDYHHGQIMPSKGIKCRQISRATLNKEFDDKTGYTYKHAADIAFWNGKFYVQYLCNPKDEHTGAGLCILASSADSINWSFEISFPEYRIPKCTVTDYKGETHSFDGNSFAFNHHRMCFYKSNEGRMLLLSFYGWSPKPWMCNWDNYGIGRVVRELYKDGSLGEIFFIYPCWQGGWSKELLNYKLYDESVDEGFIKACDELLSNHLYTQQWAEENSDKDDIIQIKHAKKGVKNEAFCWYHINEKTIIGMWKHSLCARSNDNGKTWSCVERCPSLVMSGQKVWCEKTSDGRFAMVYDPTMETQHRYPMCVTVSEDGLSFKSMRLVHGETPPMRYEGFWKDLGPQYMRGICEGLDRPEGGALWITYSVNKEDIWIAEIPVPISDEKENNIYENFSKAGVIANWNLYCPTWAQANQVFENEKGYLRLSDSEPYDYCKVERVMSPSAHKLVSFSITPRAIQTAPLYIEVCNSKAQTAVRIIFRPNGKIYARTVAELEIAEFIVGNAYSFTLDVDCISHLYTIKLNSKLLCDNDGEAIQWKFMMATSEISRFILRTGEVRMFPNLDYVPDNKPEKPLDGAEFPTVASVYDLEEFSVVLIK